MKKKLIFRVMLPITTVIFLSFGAISLINRNLLLEVNKTKTDMHVRQSIQTLNDILNVMSDKALYASSLVAKIDFVEDAYKEYYLNRDLESSIALLRRNIKPMVKNIQTNLGYSAKIHFHLPPATSFYRSWSDKHGDDLSNFRATLLDISKTHKPLKGIEVGVSGLVVRGISPIFSKVGRRYLGSVEVILDLDKFLTLYHKNNREELGLFLNRDKLSIATNLLNEKQNESLAKSFIGNYLLINKTPGLNLQNIEADDLDNLQTGGVLIEERDIYRYGFDPILDYSGKKIAVGVYQLDETRFYEELSDENYMLIFITIIILVILFEIIYLILDKILFTKDDDKIKDEKKLAEVAER